MMFDRFQPLSRAEENREYLASCACAGREEELIELAEDVLAPFREMVMDLFPSTPAESRRLEVILDEAVDVFKQASLRSEGLL